MAFFPLSFLGRVGLGSFCAWTSAETRARVAYDWVGSVSIHSRNPVAEKYRRKKDGIMRKTEIYQHLNVGYLSRNKTEPDSGGALSARV